MTNLTLAKRRTVNKLSDIQRLIYILKNPRFDGYYEALPLSSRFKIITMIDNIDLIGLRDWIRANESEYLEDMSIRTLRMRAQQWHIKDYNNLTKSELVRELTIACEVEKVC